MKDAASGNEPSQDTNSSAISYSYCETENHSGKNLKEPLLLLCCNDALLLYHMKSVVQVIVFLIISALKS